MLELQSFHEKLPKRLELITHDKVFNAGLGQIVDVDMDAVNTK